MKSSSLSFLEGLEPRIAPAGLFTFTDVDGDVVTVKTSKGNDTDLANALTISEAGQLEKVDFTTSSVFSHTTLDITVKTRDIHGDGFVNVGLIDATGIDINATSVKGDLGKILAGDNKNLSTHNGVVSLNVHSLGAKGLSTQGDGDNDLNSLIFGRSNYLKVDTSITNASITWTTAAQNQDRPESESSTPTGLASVKAITIGKNLNGGDGEIGDGFIRVDGEIGNFKLGGNLIGGDGEGTGSIFADSLGTFSVGGSVIGGTGVGSAQILSAHGASSISIGGNLIGNAENSGRIELDVANGGTITVGGNISGGDGEGSGAILVFGSVSKVGVGGNLIGGDGHRSGVITNHSTDFEPQDEPTSSSAAINIGTISIGGSIIGGEGENSANVYVDNIGTFTLGGSIRGSQIDGDGSGAAVFNTATGITIGGNVTGGVGDASGSVIVFDNLKTFSMKGSVIGGDGVDSGELFLTVAAKGTLKSTIGGSVLGGTGESSGVVDVGGEGTIALAIAGKVQGGEGDGSADIYGNNNLSSLTIGGSLLGGDGAGSGSLILTGCGCTSVLLKTLSIGGDVIGGEGSESASILVNNVTNLTVGGEFAGGSGDLSASLSALNIDNLSIGQDLAGGAGENSGQLLYLSGKTLSIGGSIIGGNDGISSGIVATGTMSSVDIGGSIIGGEADGSGELSLGGLGPLNRPDQPLSTTPLKITIGGDVIGGDGDGSGLVNASILNGPATIGIGGQVLGGSGDHAGSFNIISGLASLSIGGDVTGGSGNYSGSIFSSDDSGTVTKNVTIGGNLIGGTGNHSGEFAAENSRITSFNVLGNVIGGQNTVDVEPDSLTDSGFITAGTIDTLNVGGSLIAGIAGNDSDLNLGAIRVGILGTLNVNCSIEGTEGNNFLITAQGNLSATAKTNLAIGAINVSGDVKYADILAGYDTFGTTLNGDGGENGGTAQIGKVYVAGDWHAASLTAGTNTGESNQWGTDTNLLLAKPEGSKLVASIASIQIDGIASGYTDTDGAEEIQNGFVAEKIGSLTVADEVYTIPPAPGFVQVGPNPALVARLVTALA